MPQFLFQVHLDVLPSLARVSRTWTIWVLATSCALRLGLPASGTVPVAGAQGTSSPGPLFVALDQLNYRVDPLSPSFRVSVVLAPVPGAGIVSYGITFKFDNEAFELGRPGIEIPAGLDHNGFAGPGALTDAGPGFVSVKGTVDFLGQAIVRYDAPLVLSIILAPKNAVPGESTILSLEPYFTAGPEESLFVDGDGRVLDDDLVFRASTVEFVPEPSPGALLALGAALLGSRRRRCPRRSTVPSALLRRRYTP